jgi:hypothetical protein
LTNSGPDAARLCRSDQSQRPAALFSRDHAHRRRIPSARHHRRGPCGFPGRSGRDARMARTARAARRRHREEIELQRQPAVDLLPRSRRQLPRTRRILHLALPLLVAVCLIREIAASPRSLADPPTQGSETRARNALLANNLCASKCADSSGLKAPRNAAFRT